MPNQMEEPDLEQLKRTDDVLLRLFGVAMDNRLEEEMNSYATARMHLRQYARAVFGVHLESLEVDP